MNLANEVSTMETEIASLREELDIRRKREALLEFENEQYKIALAKTRAERDNYMRRATTVKAILDQTGASLVNAMQRYHDSEREIQEQRIGETTDAPPKFLAQPQEDLVNVDIHSAGWP
jgi:predicted  nucleic acid-binding Zn-ribbon protein